MLNVPVIVEVPIFTFAALTVVEVPAVIMTGLTIFPKVVFPETARFPEKVDVAVVVVAFMFPNVPVVAVRIEPVESDVVAEELVK